MEPEQETKKPEETEVQKTYRLVEEKKQVEAPPGNIIEMTEEEFRAQISRADPDRQATAAQVQARLNRLLSGQEKPKNEMVAYLVDRLRNGRDEFQLLQTNIQEVSTRLKEQQLRLIQLQGEQNNRAKDVAAWWDRDMKTEPGELAKEASDPAKKEE